MCRKSLPNTWAETGPAAVAEVAAVGLIKGARFTPKDIPKLADLLQIHVGGQDVVMRIDAEKLELQQANLEDSTYNHMKKELDYDCQQWRVYIGG